jgi:hypothetical protein
LSVFESACLEMTRRPGEKMRRFTAMHAEIAEKYRMFFSALSAVSAVKPDFFTSSEAVLARAPP